FPTEHAFFDEHLAGRALIEGPAYLRYELGFGPDDVAPAPAQRKARPEDGRIARLLDDGASLLDAVRIPRARARKTDLGHCLLEKEAILRLADGRGRSPD